MAKRKHQEEGDVLTEERTRTKRPPLYKVLLLNDDYTPMEFVVHVLENIFHKDRPEAVQIMLSVHHKGKGICGLYPHEIANQKMNDVHKLARANEYPLKCSVEEA